MLVSSLIPRCAHTTLATAAALLLAASAHAQSIVNLGTLQPTHQFAQANSVSADGTAVVGMSSVEFWNNTRAFRWTNGGMVDIGNTPNALNVIGSGISADGTYIAGTCYGGERATAFRWSQAGGMEDLGVLPDSQFGAEAYGISGDGSVVIGTCNADRAFRWTSANGMQDLGTLPGGSYAWAFSTSGNGQVVTGLSGTGAGERGFIWTQASGMQPLSLINGVEYSAGLSISADGSTVAGYSENFAARWVNGVGESIGMLDGGTFSVAYAISGDGHMLGGTSDNAAGDIAAIIWTEQLGMVDLNVYLPSIGIDLTGWQLNTTTGISFDGTTIVGAGTFEGADRAWLVTIPTPGAAGLLGLGGLVAGRRRRDR